MIIGAGPAGLAAAQALIGSGLKAMLVDHASKTGWLLALGRSNCRREGWFSPGPQEIEDKFKADGNQVLLDTFVAGAYEGNFFTLVQSRLDSAGLAGERIWKLRAKKVVLATGALDRPIVFENNDRPGIMLSSSVRQFIGEYGVAPGKNLLVFTNNNSGYLTATKARQVGLNVVVVDTRKAPPSNQVEAAKSAENRGSSWSLRHQCYWLSCEIRNRRGCRWQNQNHSM